MTRRDDDLLLGIYHAIFVSDVRGEKAEIVRLVEAYVDSDPRVQALNEIRDDLRRLDGQVIPRPVWSPWTRTAMGVQRILDRLDAEAKR